MAEKMQPAKRRGIDSIRDLKRVKKAKVADTSTKETTSKTPFIAEQSFLTRKPPRKMAADCFVEKTTSKEQKPVNSIEPRKVGSRGSTKLEQDIEASDSENHLISPQALDLFGADSESDSESEGIELEKLPPPPQEHIAAAKVITENKKHKADENEGTGTLYIGHIPHGFYEQQMREYFSQFGKIKRLRLSRNRRTGAAKHYAFVEFELSEVADIVQKTMDKYLMFGHILQVRHVPQEQIHENLWKGANKRFKKIPWGDIQARKNTAPQTREVWRKRVAREEKRREKKKQIMEEYGYEFNIPELKQIDDVASKAQREDQTGIEEQKVIANGPSKGGTVKHFAASEKQSSTANSIMGNADKQSSPGTKLREAILEKGKRAKGKNTSS